MEQYLEAGRIVNTHGVRGEVKIEPWADEPAFLTRFKTLYIDGQPRRLLGARTHGRFVLARLEGVESVEDAMRLRNRVVRIDRAEAALPEGAYFIADILGFTVHDLRTGSTLGKLAEVLELPAGDIYRVRGAAGDILIPARDEFLRGVDFGARVVRVETIPGMDEAQ